MRSLPTATRFSSAGRARSLASGATPATRTRSSRPERNRGAAARDAGAARMPLPPPPPPRRSRRQPPPAPAPKEPPSQMVRRIVKRGNLASNVKRSRQSPGCLAAVVIVAMGSGCGVATDRMGLFESPEQAFARLADDYQGRVVLVEVGVSHNGRYAPLGNGTGFFADQGGLIVTNKHVVHAHLYVSESACVAQSFRRRGIAYEKALVISVWPGGTRVQAEGHQSRRRSRPWLQHGSTARSHSWQPRPTRCTPPVTIQCRIIFGGPAVHLRLAAARDGQSRPRGAPSLEGDGADSPRQRRSRRPTTR